MTTLHESQKTNEKNRVLESARKLSDARDEIIYFFEKGTFPYKDNTFKTKEKEWEKESEEESEEESEKERFKKFLEYIENESKDINYDLFKDYFDVLVPSALAKKLYETKNKNKNNELVELINFRWSNLKDEIEKMTENEIKTEKPHKILEIVKEILDFNKKNKKQQKASGLKILTPNEMLSRLPISLAQLKAGNNSEKLKNEIRQLLYSLYKSKKLTKQLHKSLVDII